MIDNIETVYYTALFIIPGFISMAIIDKLNPTKNTDTAIYFLKCLILSCLNLVCLWVCYKVTFTLKESHPVRCLILLSLEMILGSVFVGFVLAIIKQKFVIERIFSKMNINFIHPIPKAWDYIFSKEKGSYVIVTLSDNQTVYGWFGWNSFASSEDDYNDIYLETVFDEDWNEIKDVIGMYIAKDQIKQIEFIKNGGYNDGQSEQCATSIE